MQHFQLNLARALAVMFLATAACAADSLPPLFRQVHDCNVDLNPILSYDGLSTLSTIKIRGQEHLANAVPAVRGKGTARKVGFYLLTDADRAMGRSWPMRLGLFTTSALPQPLSSRERVKMKSNAGAPGRANSSQDLERNVAVS